MPRIFFDSNVGTHGDGYRLVLGQSISDLHALGDELRDDKVVAIYMPDELEMLATLRFAASDYIWIAHPIAGSIRYSCRCCGAFTLLESGGWEICDVCGWEDDPVQAIDPDFAGGANEMTLRQAQGALHRRQSNRF